MKKLQLFEPAMCCPTGLCGVGVDDNLLRISKAMTNLKSHGVHAERFNLSDQPQAFIDYAVVTHLMSEKGMESLPITMVDGEVVKSGSYPTDEELIAFLVIPSNFLEGAKKPTFTMASNSCSDEGCC